MANQIILAVDDEGKFLEYIPKEAGHTGDGKKHLAISVLIYNNKGQVLLQKRKHKVFDNIWDITASTHQFHREDGTDETNEQASIRALKEEYGIEKVEGLRVVGAIDYFARFGELCENEHDVILAGEYNGEVNLNPTVGYECKWIDKKEFLSDIESNPKKYAPWAIEGTKLLKKINFF